MARIEQVVEIAAPPERVWEISTDVERWPEWASNFREVRRIDSGPFGPRSSARIRQRGIPESTWRMLSFDEGRAFAWQARLFPGLHSVGRHVVEPAGDGTRVTLGVELTGPFAPLVRRMAAVALRTEAADLKARAERGP
jgi:uncharacterized protein YndB with AHSA1/START domain